MNSKPLEKLEEKKHKIEARIDLLKTRERKKARKLRTRNLIQVGGLAEIAGLHEMDKGVLLGALLEVAKIAKNKVMVQQWKAAGDHLLKKREIARFKRKKPNE